MGARPRRVRTRGGFAPASPRHAPATRRHAINRGLNASRPRLTCYTTALRVWNAMDLILPSGLVRCISQRRKH